MRIVDNSNLIADFLNDAHLMGDDDNRYAKLLIDIFQELKQ